MNDMKELITEDQARQIIMILSVLITLASLSFGFFWQSRISKPKRKPFWANVILAAMIGPLLWILWLVYNSIEDYYGLDSVKALLINLGLFAAVGLLLSFLFSVVPPHFSKSKKA
jgi:hypothetical protein